MLSLLEAESVMNLYEPAANLSLREEGVMSACLELYRFPNKNNGAHCRFRTYDPYRVKVMLYH